MLHRNYCGRVLVVDDESATRRVLAAVLAAAGHEVTQAATAAHAWQILQIAPRPDVVLLDILMPETDGFALLTQIRAAPNFGDLPVVMVSALHDTASQVDAFELGADDYLTKPISATILRARVSCSIERSQARAAQQRLMAELHDERERSERLLHNILPERIVTRLKVAPEAIADTIRDASVIFVDVVGFTSMSERTPPMDLVKCLNRLFAGYDDVAAQLGVEKIKTIGDAYMAVAGVPEPRADHVEAAVRFAQAASQMAPTVRWPNGSPLRVRVGVHCGTMVAGVVGKNKFAYDVWGDVVNTAARLQAACEPGRVLLSDEVRARLAGRAWHISDEHELQLKGKGPMSAAYLLGDVETCGS